MLENIANLKSVHGNDVVIMDKLRESNPELFREDGSMKYDEFETNVRPHKFIYVRLDKNSLSFTLQNGPVKESGVNGCQIPEVLGVVKELLLGLDSKFPSAYNKESIMHVEAAIQAQYNRTKDREARNVEGTNHV